MIVWSGITETLELRAAIHEVGAAAERAATLAAGVYD
jgi:hypothetical protein